MTISGSDRIAVIYYNNIAITIMCCGIDNKSVGGRADWSAEVSGYIEPCMIFVAVAERVASIWT